MKKIIMLSLLTIITFLTASETNKAQTTEKIDKINKADKTEKKEPTRLQTAEGIGYEILQEGIGDSPVDGQKVSIHYTGWVNDNGIPGNKIDSSKDRNLPVKFELGRNIIKGWDNIIRLMKPGAIYRIYIPSSLGYGSKGLPGIVPPNSSLIFDIELLKI